MLNKLFTNEFLQDTDVQDFKKGDLLIQEGAASNETMYFILNGTCSVFKKQGETPVLINQLKTGDFFGEIALISNQPRTATVQVESDSAKLLLFSKKKFIQQTVSNPVLMFSILKAAIARFLRADVNFENTIKSIPNMKPDLIIKLNQNHVKLVNIKALNYIHSLPILNLGKNLKIYSETKDANPHMYFILRGNISLLKEHHGKNVEVATLELGHFFGETSFISDTPYTHSAITKSDDVKLVQLDKVAFLKIVNLHPEFLLNNLKNTIWKLINTEKATFNLKSRIVKEPPQATTDLKVYKKSDYIIKEGDASNETMYFILEGAFAVLKNRGETVEEVNVLKSGDFFGELSLISSQPRTASIQVKSDSGKLLLFSKEKFIQKTKESPGLMFSILKATVARLMRAESSIDKIIKSLPELDPAMATRLNESRIDNINVFNYVHNLHSRILLKGDRIYAEGEKSDGAMYFIYEGTIAVIKKYHRRNMKITTYEKGDFFGETSLITDSPRNQTLITASEKAKVVKIDKDILMKIVHISPGFLFSLLRTVIWKLIIAEKALFKLNMKVDDIYEKKS
ncbi:MAG: cyclic nucleotide-binding domain-containing protein [Leptospiraceae bacterium]|nr:cyclic nucleotide-binding domain-containing protein [Leptospiraceae bacterium]